MPDRLPPAPSTRDLVTLYAFITPEYRGFHHLPPFDWWKPMEWRAFQDARRERRKRTTTMAGYLT